MRVISTAIVLTAALVAAAPAIDFAAAPKPKDVNVTLTFHDDGANIVSDSLGDYQGGAGGVLASILVTDKGQVSFSTGTKRTLLFTFENCVLLPSECHPTYTFVNDDARLLAHPLRDGVNPPGGLLGMTTAEGELPAFVKIDIPNDLDPAYWNLCFDAGDRFPPCAAVSGSSTNARIVRTANDEWILSATIEDSADLVRDSNTRRTRTYDLEGTYAMPFSVTIKCVNAADCP